MSTDQAVDKVDAIPLSVTTLNKDSSKFAGAVVYLSFCLKSFSAYGLRHSEMMAKSSLKSLIPSYYHVENRVA